MTNRLLIAARKASGKSQPEVAETIGVSKSTWNRWEQEKTFPHQFHRRKLCLLFGKTEQELGLIRSVSLDEKHLPVSFDPLIPTALAYPLIGRDRELAQVKARLIESNTGALTALYGLPGVGKTARRLRWRMMMRYARALQMASFGLVWGRIPISSIT